MEKLARKPTQLQKKALNNLVANGGTVAQAMRDAGYSETTLRTPQKLTESQGFVALCEEQGLTEEFLVKALVEDIEKKPQNRKSEVELGFKVLGRLKDKDDGRGDTFNFNFFNEHQLRKVAARTVNGDSKS